MFRFMRFSRCSGYSSSSKSLLQISIFSKIRKNIHFFRQKSSIPSPQPHEAIHMFGVLCFWNHRKLSIANIFSTKKFWSKKIYRKNFDRKKVEKITNIFDRKFVIEIFWLFFFQQFFLFFFRKTKIFKFIFKIKLENIISQWFFDIRWVFL